jgi:hypothetical protein
VQLLQKRRNTSYNYCYDTRLWERNGTSTGRWTACHCAAGNFVPTECWECKLQSASSTTTSTLPSLAEQQQHRTSSTTSLSNDKVNSFLHNKNALGQTVIDIFFRSHIRPVPRQKIQLKVRSHRLINYFLIVYYKKKYLNNNMITYKNDLIVNSVIIPNQ